MSYLVLARKWRPRSFDTLIGQDHVVRALTHALSSGRLHHAWLFTGTRGVGKTTLSRILAKSLNCVQGVTATPCGHCQACTEIDAGRYVDYIELDAASNRGVDEMTQLLEQAVYAPSSGRFKVYMIDEVHMLTGHAFNAMLKTLEEPPEHVKFILATTDPQKIPVTVLSRCLQFNLKQMTVPAIVDHLQDILAQESVPAEPRGLRLIAQAAAGSMRDALSLTDQAISFSAGNLTAAAVGEMLGTLDQHHLVNLLRALAAADAPGILAVADDLAVRGLSFQAALGDLAVLLSRVAIAQRLGHAQPDDPLAEDVTALAGALTPDDVQLFYAVAVHSRQELTLAPDEHAGFVMACLRMLALLPEGRVPPAVMGPPPTAEADARPAAVTTAAAPAVENTASAPTASTPAAPPPTPAPVQHAVAAAGPAAADLPAWEAPQQEPALASPAEPDTAGVPSAPAAPVQAAGSPRPPKPSPEPDPAPDRDPPPDPDPAPPAPPDEAASATDDWTDAVPDDLTAAFDAAASLGDLGMDPDASAVIAGLTAEPSAARPETPDPGRITAHDWPAVAAGLSVSGAARALALNSEWLSGDDHRIRLRVAIHTYANGGGHDRLRTVLSEYFGRVLRLEVEYGATGDDTAHAIDQAERSRRQQAAEQAVEQDELVRVLAQRFSARVVPDSVRPPGGAPSAYH
ncbi:DNA polymerase III subunit gamma/tau [Castellaniella daejeonensis]|uniref:DNA polymerase III subunit gamma/tau n=1 Tax=Castellaniella daejeonensis TaxID=659013 RepID=UPI0031D3E843